MSRIFVTIWVFCTAFLFTADWFLYVEPFGKLLVFIIGLIASIVMTGIAFTKRKQAEVELKISQLKYEQEQIQKRIKEEEETNLFLDDD